MKPAVNTMTPEQLEEWERKARAGELFGGVESPIADRIEAVADRLYPDGNIPWGGVREIASETGCSASWVSQVLSGAHLKRSRANKPRKTTQSSDRTVTVIEHVRTHRDELVAAELERLRAKREAMTNG